MSVLHAAFLEALRAELPGVELKSAPRFDGSSFELDMTLLAIPEPVDEDGRAVDLDGVDAQEADLGVPEVDEVARRLVRGGVVVDRDRGEQREVLAETDDVGARVRQPLIEVRLMSRAR